MTAGTFPHRYASSYFYTDSVPLSAEREVVLYADRAYARNDQVLI
jgi:hypothetical protein